MYQLTRTNTFETNSSSIHSLVIKSRDNDKKLEDLNYYITLEEFGWETSETSDTQDILSYLWTMCFYGGVDNLKYANLMKNYLPNCTFQEPEVYDNLYDDFHSIEGKKYDPENPYVRQRVIYWDNKDWYIDHGGDWWTDGMMEEIFEPENFKDLVFNGLLFTTNDNEEIDYKPSTDGIKKWTKYN